MNISSFFARSYVDALSVALSPTAGNRAPRRPVMASLAARAAAERLQPANDGDLPRAA
jgi:hypothetical protein